MSENTVNGPEDSVVGRMVKQLPRENLQDAFKIGSWCWKMPPVLWRVVKLVFLRKPDAAPQGYCIDVGDVVRLVLFSAWKKK